MCSIIDNIIDDDFVKFRFSCKLDFRGVQTFRLLFRGFGTTPDKTTLQFLE